MTQNDTICAISTPIGVGGIALIRVSGDKSIEICDKIFVAQNGTKLINTVANRVGFGIIISGTNLSTTAQNIIDEVLVSVFRAPHSFTGENIVEISAHGSAFIQQEILKRLIVGGCRLATAGEFTQRAFLAGKMDLSQAEAVADLIASQSAAAHRMAVSQMRGGFCGELKTLRSQLLDFLSLIELELDFSEEDIEFADRSKLAGLATEIERKIDHLTASFSTGNVLKNGIPVVLAGATNTGKSTLLNLLLNEEKALVSEIHGTTRDVIEDCINIQGIRFRFIDTAGIRQSDDAIENLGIERACRQIEQASIVLWMVDSSNVFTSAAQIPEMICKYATNKKILLIFNKIDMVSEKQNEEIDQLFSTFECEKIKISAKYRLNTDILQKILLEYVNTSCGTYLQSDVIVSNIRHYEALKNALFAIKKVQEGLQSAISGDLLAQDIRECMHYFGEITGEITTDEVLKNIFGRFCIGK